ncbi:hypothetical protein RE9431_38760 [Prescottella equi]|uniref:hypothetical protein n=1 Tax=Rhodococcus hoagii TaxID=43767 RepID=UPI001C7808BB|nr:hypothetical protein [Prescottella equi]BCN65421.1 hypothetical protein RE9431_38760 [Prescottella equi]BCN75265.1 hypothetical protein RE0327_38640 [Prescottella equi]
MIPAILLVCVPLFVALVGHSAYRVHQADREHRARIDGVPSPAAEPPPPATYTEW